MAMDKINGSPLLRQSPLDQSRSNEKVDQSSQQVTDNGTTGQGEAQPAKGDTVEISDTAHRLMALRQAVDTGRAALADLPETRADKLALARERLESGFYNSSSVREKVATGVDRVIAGIDEL